MCSEADEMGNRSSLMSHFTWQHYADPQDIRTYLGVGIKYEKLCRENRRTIRIVWGVDMKHTHLPL